MPSTINPIRAFTERVCLSLSKLDYDAVGDEEIIAEEQLSCPIGGQDTLALVSVVYECGQVICRLRPVNEPEGSRAERELGICEAIGEDEVHANNSGCDLTGELTDSDLFRSVFSVVQSITGIREEAA